MITTDNQGLRSWADQATQICMEPTHDGIVNIFDRRVTSGIQVSRMRTCVGPRGRRMGSNRTTSTPVLPPMFGFCWPVRDFLVVTSC